jgi:hypothetical protein
LLYLRLRERGADCIINAQNTIPMLHNLEGPRQGPEAHEKRERRKYLPSPVLITPSFSHRSGSTDGLIGKEAKTLLKKRVSLLAEKWESLPGRGYNAQVSIAIVRATHHCLRRLCIPTSQMSRDRRPSGKATPDSVLLVITPRSFLA